jgi:hypothetical protein
MKALSLFVAWIAFAAPPSITELQPRGVQKGRPFTLTITGQNLGEGARILSTLPATFTPLGTEYPMYPTRYSTFLVEPKSEWDVGVYPIRVQTPDGLSNILLLNVGSLPEMFEDESRPGGLPNSNDSIEKAQALPASAITLNGTLRGPERDVYRVQVKAGERRVFEVDARRAGSAIDPVIRLLDGNGKVIARSEDNALLQLDARLEHTFAAAGYYYLEVHDARFSAQAQNYYRLKTGSFAYASELFPIGGQRGALATVSLSGTPIQVDLKSTARQTWVNLPDSPALPFAFAIGEFAERIEPVAEALKVPVTINGRLSAAKEIDEFTFDVEPNEGYAFELIGREMGASKIIGIITAFDQNGKKIGSAGDQPLPVDVGAVAASSRTASDPVLTLQTAADTRKITIKVEDLALRGGAYYAYRLSAWKAPHDARATIVTPYTNIPAGGTQLIVFNIDRRGYVGPLQVKAVNLPKGIAAAGGYVPPEVADASNRSPSRRAIVTLSAEPGAATPDGDLEFVVETTNESGQVHRSKAAGMGYVIAVNGATAQGVVDRQRALTGAWLGHSLPAAIAPALDAKLDLKLESITAKGEGYEVKFRWTWITRNPGQAVPDSVNVDVPNFIDFRVIGMQTDPADRKSGTFLVTSTRNTMPSLYNIAAMGRIRMDGQDLDIVSPVRDFTLPAIADEEKKPNETRAANN